jgi:hypothetical protein
MVTQPPDSRPSCAQPKEAARSHSEDFATQKQLRMQLNLFQSAFIIAIGHSKMLTPEPANLAGADSDNNYSGQLWPIAVAA